MKEEFNVGDKVIVPWGLDELPGEIVNVYPSGLGQRIVVRVEVPGTPAEVEDTLITLPASALLPVVSNASPAASGSWAPPLHYERQVRETLQRLRPEFPLSAYEDVRRDGDTRVDFIARLSTANRLYVEAKYRSEGRLGPDAVMQLAQISQEGNEQAYLLLIANVDLTMDALNLLNTLKTSGTKIQAVTWRGEEDDHKLSQALDELLMGR